ncbi:MAG: hypothetical protein GYA23_01920, partial [Methanomicrobiales archaeon]|nr:hypothetical protein [Methanomicrobiales archaeon]
MGGGFDAGSIWIKVGIDTVDFKQGISDVNKEIRDIDTKPARNQINGMREDILDMGKDWKKTALAITEITAPIALAAYGLNKVTSDAAAAADRMMNEESRAVAQEYAAQLAEVNAQLEAAYIEIGVNLIPVMQQMMPIITETIVPAMEMLANTLGLITSEFIMASEAAQAFQSALFFDSEGAATHFQNATEAGIRGNDAANDLMSGTSDAGLTSSSTGDRVKGTSISKSKALYNAKHGITTGSSGGVTQVVHINATQQTPSQIKAAITGASRG